MRHQSNRDRLLAIPEMVRLLKSYAAAIDNTQDTMQRLDVAATCGRCAEESGSCCFQEVETWYDSMLLLINLLLNADLPRARRLHDQCLFLGPTGCQLHARYSFCLNYFCPALQTRLGPVLMNAVRAAVGQELLAGWELEQFLYRWFREADKKRWNDSLPMVSWVLAGRK